MKVFFYFSLVVYVAFCACTSQIDYTAGGVPPGQALATFELPEDLQIELVAAEPLVADPVAMEIDEDGNTYVLEMHGYPMDLSGSGVVKKLIDNDGDGVFDKSIVFADSLLLPTGLMRWKKGLLVVDVPDLVYLEDTDGDGKADKKEVVLSGFAVTNPQHIANTPLYGPDNWIYIAHQGAITPKVAVEFADEGAEVRFPGNEDAPRLPVDANGRNIRLKPDTWQLEMLAGESQYGQTFDVRGHHFGTSNADHLFAEIIAARYLARNPNLLVAEATENIPDHGNAAEVFPITARPEHQLLTDVGVITSSCGVTWYLGGLLEGYEDVTFIAEPVHNLVHADRVQPKGASFSASRLFENKEFLASTDAWFRPVQFYVGPQGELFVIDYYRQVVEHPEWMSDEVNQSGALYNGSNMGRIYKITPKNWTPRDTNKPGQIGAYSTAELVGALGSRNIWWRRHAQRLLVDRKEKEAVALLKDFLIENPAPASKIAALWTLEGIDGLDGGVIRAALNDGDGGVRENAIRLAELYLDRWPELERELLLLQTDPDPKVRYQLLNTLGFLSSEKATLAIQNLLFNDIEDNWVQIAALSASHGSEMDLIREAIGRMGSLESEGRARFIANCASVISLGGEPEKVKNLLQLALGTTATEANQWWKAAILSGVKRVTNHAKTGSGAFVAERNALMALFDRQTPSGLRAEGIQLLQAMGGTELKPTLVRKAEQIAVNRAENIAFRLDAVALLSALPSSGGIFEQLLIPSEPESIQKAAMESYMKSDRRAASEFAIANWSHITPSVREVAMKGLMSSKVTMEMVINALQEDKIDVSSLAWHYQVRLMNNDDDGIRDKARKLLASGGDPVAVVEQYKPVLTLPGNRINGAKVFENTCATCHQIGGKDGKSFGPDLATIRNRDKQFILADILDPNRSIADGFELWELELDNGENPMGIIASETASALTLKDAAGNETTISRDRIKSLKASPTSAMPAGLHNGLTTEQMADLLVFLKSKE